MNYIPKYIFKNVCYATNKINSKYHNLIFYNSPLTFSTYFAIDYNNEEQFLISFNGSKELYYESELLMAINLSDNDIYFNLNNNFMHINHLKLLFTDQENYIYNYKNWNNYIDNEKNTEYINSFYKILKVPKNSIWLWEVI